MRLACAQWAIRSERLPVRAHADERVGEKDTEMILAHSKGDLADAAALFDEEVPHEIVGRFAGLGRGFQNSLALEGAVLVRWDAGDEDLVPGAQLAFFEGEMGPQALVKRPVA